MTGGVWVSGDNSITTPPLFKDTTFFVQDSTCTPSLRKAIFVKVNPMPSKKTSVSGNIIFSNQVGATYQWYNCTANSIIPGAKSPTYVASPDSFYKVVITLSGCVDTSNCFSLNGIMRLQSNSAHSVSIYPNPTTDFIKVQGSEYGKYNLVNELGQMVHSFELNNSNNFETIIYGMKAGVYYLHTDVWNITQQENYCIGIANAH
ncbi:MAG: T9SS type A sorting domain-containing protein [Bacteroidetes bacterium]|nr:T9SS type A sorting domain-containing protein [Bacteroidota bacterium]